MSAPTVRPADPPPAPLASVVEQPTLAEAVQAYWRRVRGGDMGSLPAIGRASCRERVSTIV